ncbi:MAG TPA: diguanylate cyclase [Cellvibrio sp.]|nr:diguanylate cyclase [Cellvibrio sp.]
MGSIKFFSTICLLGALLHIQLASAQTIVKVNKPTDGNGRYAVEMAQLALSKIDARYKLEMIDAGDATQARTLSDVASGNLDLFWTATDAELESILLPIRIPLYKGMLGHRIFIIRKGDQARFDRVRTFEDLKQFRFGQGTTWADTKILEANGLNVVKAMKYPGLFYMLDGDRFDAFPRGVQEPWAELESHKDLNLVDEKRLMLVYRMPFYLFTGPQNKKLAADLELGFNRAIADGSFDKVFYSSPIVQSVIEKANLEKRLVFEIKNPNLSKETPVDRPELWLNINDLKNHVVK